MEYLLYLADIFLHIDKHLDALILNYGVWTYAILFLIVFCETGLVITPFLPGDSLLFAAGVMAARGLLDVHLIAALLIAAAIIGDTVNYHIGQYLGDRVFQNPNSKIFKKEYLERTQRFFQKYGGKAIVIARFVPIVRTFAPLLAGVGTMSYRNFIMYNVSGALLWILIFVYGGFLFSEFAVVKNNFSIVVLAIIAISVLPIVIEYVRARRELSIAAKV